MSREFFTDTRSRSGYILPDNYLGVGRAELYTLASENSTDAEIYDNCYTRPQDMVGVYERAIVLGMLDNEEKLDSCLVQFIDLQTVDKKPVYGIMSVDEMALGLDDREKMCRGTRRVPVEFLCKVGSIVTVEITAYADLHIFNRGKETEVQFCCSRANVMRTVRGYLSALNYQEELVGLVVARANQWGFKIDLGAGFYVVLDESKCQKFNLRQSGVFEGAIITLYKDIDYIGNVEYAVYHEPWHTWCQITHRSRVEGIVNRADSEGSVYCYVPNCGFIYIAGVARLKNRKNIGFTSDSEKFNCLSHSSGVETEDGLDTYEVGDKVLIEVVQGFGSSVCGYIIKKLKSHTVCTVC